MARRKLKYTKDEITNNLYTAGEEWMTTEYQEYIGLYHRYSTGEVYTLAQWNPQKSIELIPYRILPPGNKTYQLLKEDLTTLYETLEPYRLEISNENRKTGYITRYLAYNIVIKKIIEIDKETYDKIQKKKIDPNLYESISLRWYITGELNDNDLTKGILTKNKKERTIASRKIPAVVKYLNNLSEYYTDVTYTVPKDINNLDN